MQSQSTLKSLLRASDFIAALRYSPATAGNFSIRSDDDQMLVSPSGKDKTALAEEDFIRCDFAANKIAGVGSPSAEALLHGMIYQHSCEAACVLHTHSVPVTVLSMVLARDEKITFQGYEMQKTIGGRMTHEDALDLFIFDNDQNMSRLAPKIAAEWPKVAPAFGFIVRGHGLYSWGNSVADAKRHMEGLEFLMQCEFAKRQLVR